MVPSIRYLLKDKMSPRIKVMQQIPCDNPYSAVFSFPTALVPSSGTYFEEEDRDRYISSAITSLSYSLLIYDGRLVQQFIFEGQLLHRTAKVEQLAF